MNFLINMTLLVVCALCASALHGVIDKALDDLATETERSDRIVVYAAAIAVSVPLTAIFGVSVGVLFSRTVGPDVPVLGIAGFVLVLGIVVLGRSKG